MSETNSIQRFVLPLVTDEPQTLKEIAGQVPPEILFADLQSEAWHLVKNGQIRLTKDWKMVRQNGGDNQPKD